MKLIVFDYDGVIMDTFATTMKIYGDLSDEFGLNLPDNVEFYKDLFELDWRETMKKLNVTSKKDMDKNVEIYLSGLKKYGNLIKPYPKIDSVLYNLSRKYKLAVVSNNFRSEVEPRLQKFGLRKYFGKIYGGEDGELKPSPEMLIKCMDSYGFKSKDTVFIGDMDGDIACGKSAKVNKMIAVTYGYHLKERLKDADIIIHRPEEILEVI